MQLARLCLGLLLAVTAPANVPYLAARRGWAFLVSFSLAAYAAFPVLGFFESAAMCLGAALLGFITITRAHGHTWKIQTAPKSWLASSRSIRFPPEILGILALTALAGFLLQGSRIFSKFVGALADNQVAVVVIAALLAIFSTNDIVLIIVRPYTRVLDSSDNTVSSLAPSGIYLGWIERALVFAFVVSSQADAAALTIAAKSLVRLPEVQRDQAIFGEYVIVGTLASSLAATVLAVVGRLALGLTPL